MKNPRLFYFMVSKQRFYAVITIGGEALKRYYVGGQEVTEAEAKEIENENREVLRSGTIEELLNIKRIIVKED